MMNSTWPTHSDHLRLPFRYWRTTKSFRVEWRYQNNTKDSRSNGFSSEKLESKPFAHTTNNIYSSLTMIARLKLAAGGLFALSRYHYDDDNGGPRAKLSPNWMKPDHSIDDDLINPSPICFYQMILCEKFSEFAEGRSSNGNSRSSGFQRNMNDFPRWRNLLWWMVERMMRHSSFYYNKFGMFRGKRQHSLSAVGCFRFGHCLDKHQTHKSRIFPYFNFHAFEWIQHCWLSTE